MPNLIFYVCIHSEPLNIIPHFGNMLGGTAIALHGPCFLPDDNVECFFDGVTLPIQVALINSDDQTVAVCVSPEFKEHGWKHLRVSIRRNNVTFYYQLSSSFYAGKFSNVIDNHALD